MVQAKEDELKITSDYTHRYGFCKTPPQGIPSVTFALTFETRLRYFNSIDYHEEECYNAKE